MKMKIELKVIPGAKKNCLKKEGDRYKAYITAPASDGKANKALVDLLSDEFGVPKRGIEIIKGLKSRHKTISINES